MLDPNVKSLMGIRFQSSLISNGWLDGNLPSAGALGAHQKKVTANKLGATVVPYIQSLV